MNYSKSQKGYTLLFSIIVASVVLSIAAFILSISRKQFILSAAARDSMVAIYAADSGIQCALKAFYNSKLSVGSGAAVITCNGNPEAKAFYKGYDSTDDSLNTYGFKTDSGEKFYITERPIKLTLPGETCALVTVAQGKVQGATELENRTFIISRGYNLGNSWPCVETAPANPRAIERAIKLKIEG